MMFSSSQDKLDVREALRQMKDDSLMVAANLAYRHADTHPKCEECALAIGDQIRALMRPQR